jgi:hypothetical protein
MVKKQKRVVVRDVQESVIQVEVTQFTHHSFHGVCFDVLDRFEGVKY